MTIDDVAIDEHRAAALKFLGDAGLSADHRKIIGFFYVNLKAILAQVCGIAFAAVALRAFIKEWHAVTRRRPTAGGQQQRGSRIDRKSFGSLQVSFGKAMPIQ